MPPWTRIRRDRPRLAVTLGDVRGIGPEIVRKRRRRREVRDAADLVLVGPARRGHRRRRTDQARGPPSGTAATPADFAGRAVERAVALALEGEVDGIVTAPLDKAALLAGGYSISRPHRDARDAHRTARRDDARRHASRVAGRDEPAARRARDDAHPAARRAARRHARRDRRRRERHARTGCSDWFGIAEPRIALCALNPHAGDGGRFGTRGRRAACAQPRARRASPARFPPTRCSCARCAASSTP